MKEVCWIYIFMDTFGRAQFVQYTQLSTTTPARKALVDHLVRQKKKEVVCIKFPDCTIWGDFLQIFDYIVNCPGKNRPIQTGDKEWVKGKIENMILSQTLIWCQMQLWNCFQYMVSQKNVPLRVCCDDCLRSMI